MAQQLTIGKLAELTGNSTDTLRYYEKLGLLKARSRTAAGYRMYDKDAVRVIRFIRGAKALNFTLEEIRNLLALDTSDLASCAQVLAETEGKIAEAEVKIKELREIKKVLQGLVKACPGDATSARHCPILEHLQGVGKVALMLVFMGMLFVGFGQHAAAAKPLSYVDGLMVMQENDETGNTLTLDYTLTPRMAVGLYAKHENGGREFNTVGPQVNTLLKRWNLPHGQGNIFNMTGVGVSHWDGADYATVWTGFLADYETRRIFSSYEAKFMVVDDVERSVWQRARIGFAPYLADYGDVNTWLMLQVDHHPMKDDTLVVTPLVRFFYGTTLVEAGYSSNKNAMLNWVLQF